MAPGILLLINIQKQLEYLSSIKLEPSCRDVRQWYHSHLHLLPGTLWRTFLEAIYSHQHAIGGRNSGCCRTIQSLARHHSDQSIWTGYQRHLSQLRTWATFLEFDHWKIWSWADQRDCSHHCSWFFHSCCQHRIQCQQCRSHLANESWYGSCPQFRSHSWSYLSFCRFPNESIGVGTPFLLVPILLPVVRHKFEVDYCFAGMSNIFLV